MSRKVLHLLSQRPDFTGSGVSLAAVVRCGAAAGWEQAAVVGVPREDPRPEVGALPRERIHPLLFDQGDLDFPLPGMSDVMPYPSSEFSELTPRQLEAYRNNWKRHLGVVIDRFRPDLIHTRHIWLLSALVKDVAPDLPVVNQCHATGLRQMLLCPHLAEEVKRGCARNERFVVLHRGHAEWLTRELEVAPDRIHTVGTGYPQDIFHARGRATDAGNHLLYAGKYSRAKGLPQLLDAVQRLAKRRENLVLHVAGDGAGLEAEALRRRMAGLEGLVVMHGQLDRRALADLMRRCAVFVLPSFYEGLPRVLVEALACGCRPVCSDLPGIREGLGQGFDPILHRVAMPPLIGPDVPAPDALDGFVDRLVAAVSHALDSPSPAADAETLPAILEPFTWEAVFGRIERVWRALIDDRR